MKGDPRGEAASAVGADCIRDDGALVDPRCQLDHLLGTGSGVFQKLSGKALEFLLEQGVAYSVVEVFGAARRQTVPTRRVGTSLFPNVCITTKGGLDNG